MGVLTAQNETLFKAVDEIKKMLQEHIDHQVVFENAYVKAHEAVIHTANNAYDRATKLDERVTKETEEITKKVESHDERIEQIEQRIKPIEELYKNTTKFLWGMFTVYCVSFLGFLWAVLNHWIYIGKLP